MNNTKDLLKRIQAAADEKGYEVFIPAIPQLREMVTLCEKQRLVAQELQSVYIKRIAYLESIIKMADQEAKRIARCS